MSLKVKILLAVNLMVCLAMLMSYMAPHIDPQKYWVFSFFGLIYPLLVLVQLIFMAIWLFTDMRLSLIPLLMIAVGYKNIGHYFAFHSKPVVNDHHDFSVISFNISNALEAYDSRSEIKAEKKQKMEAFLRRFNDEDIICLQEVGDYASDLIKQNFKSYHIHKFSKGAVILSKHKIIKKGLIEFGTKTNSCLWADIEMDSDTLRVYSIHLQSNRITEAANDVLNSDNFDQDKTWESILGILKRYRQHHRARSVQAKTVKEHISLSPYPVLVCGDFNDVPMSYTYEHISKGLVDAYKTKGSGVGSTFNGKIPFLRIDYILAHPMLKVVKFNVIRENYSDHFPVAALYSIPKV
jgi:endonuclease/exonuclease/phosphatase family metal-dependent hydrolase